jgi:hypothetical protein
MRTDPLFEREARARCSHCLVWPSLARARYPVLLYCFLDGCKSTSENRVRTGLSLTARASENRERTDVALYNYNKIDFESKCSHCSLYIYVSQREIV